jgi:hypothetical protein
MEKQMADFERFASVIRRLQLTVCGRRAVANASLAQYPRRSDHHGLARREKDP